MGFPDECQYLYKLQHLNPSGIVWRDRFIADFPREKIDIH